MIQRKQQVLIDLENIKLKYFSREDLSKKLGIEISLLNKFLNQSRPLSKMQL